MHIDWFNGCESAFGKHLDNGSSNSLQSRSRVVDTWTRVLYPQRTLLSPSQHFSNDACLYRWRSSGMTRRHPSLNILHHLATAQAHLFSGSVRGWKMRPRWQTWQISPNRSQGCAYGCRAWLLRFEGRSCSRGLAVFHFGVEWSRDLVDSFVCSLVAQAADDDASTRRSCTSWPEEGCRRMG